MTRSLKAGKKGKLQLRKFLNETGQTYSKDISSPLTAPTSCSRLSSYITYGNLSMRYIVNETKKKQIDLRKQKSRDGWLGSLHSRLGLDGIAISSKS